MRKKRSGNTEGFMKSVLVLMLSQALIKLLWFVYRIYLTNREGFGDEGNAIYSSGYQIYALLLTISSIGVPNAISKLVSEKVAIGDDKGAHRIFKVALITFGLIGLAGTIALFTNARIYCKNNLTDTRSWTDTHCTISCNIFCNNCLSPKGILQWKKQNISNGKITNIRANI